ncbi:MAG: radical SAM family heme chaperone HemW [Candidatus Protistobacter heckmanni]|nr:radical SAM family heme chaperone HemW [Candidatus Protistobacter heckmanni]
MIPIHPAGAKVLRANLDPGALSLPAPPPLSVYVHYPWCVRKCPYCDFNSHEAKSEVNEERYLQAFKADLQQSLPLVWGRRVHTVFIGGGTPSLISAAGMDRLLVMLRTLLQLEADAEITMEANPGTVEADKFAAFRASGVNRISLGIQSFNDAHLKALGRIHDSAEARRAIETAQRCFENFNLDLMYALPGQTPEQAAADLEQALAFAPPHLSLYHLTLEPNTLFAKYPPALPDEDAAYAMQDMIEARMLDAGYGHYEVSAYAKPGRQCRHNLNYWQFGDYLGIGAGTHGKLSFAHRVLRQIRHKHPQAYMDAALGGNPVQEEREVGAAELPFEFMLNALRLAEGVPLSSFAERTGLNAAAILEKLDLAEKKGLLERGGANIRPTPLGRRFLNDLQELFLED